MENDMLSLMTMNADTRSLVRKLYRMSLVLMIIAGMYAISELVQWYFFWDGPASVLKKSPHHFYYLILRPVMFIAVMALSLIGYGLNLRAYKAIKTAFDDQDPSLINKGFRNIFAAMLLSLVSFVFATFISSCEILILKRMGG
jgi:hypothetical protein